MRSFIIASLFVVVGSTARAGERCQPPDMDGNVVCEVGIPSEKMEPVTSQQRMSQWCWAASITMIFGFHGHPVAQERIVESVWGRLVDLPAMNGNMMSESLARPWVDDRGKAFRARIRVLDVDAGLYGVDTPMVIAELRAERPLLVGTVGHAVVLTAMRYLLTPWGEVQILGATVRDPWPGRGRRELEWHEMQPQYIATVEIPKRRQQPVEPEPNEVPEQVQPYYYP